jgi:hypothetical protein
MLNRIIHPIIKSVKKPISVIKKSFLERRISQLNELVQQEKVKNLPTQSKEKYKEILEKKLEQSVKE